MKKPIPALLILASFAMTLPQTAPAGGRSGNGGADYILNGKHYLLDLVEAGNQDNPYFDRTIKIDPEFDRLVRARLKKVATEEVIGLVSGKLTEISNRYPTLGRMFEFIVESSQVSTPAVSLKDPYFEASPLLYEGKNLKRVAVREENVIYLNQSLYKNFDSGNQAALWVHEWTSNLIGEIGDSVDTRKIIGSWLTEGGSEQIVKSLLMDHGLGLAIKNDPAMAVSTRCEGCLLFANDFRMGIRPYSTSSYTLTVDVFGNRQGLDTFCDAAVNNHNGYGFTMQAVIVFKPTLFRFSSGGGSVTPVADWKGTSFQLLHPYRNGWGVVNKDSVVAAVQDCKNEIDRVMQTFLQEYDLKRRQ